MTFTSRLIHLIKNRRFGIQICQRCSFRFMAMVSNVCPFIVESASILIILFQDINISTLISPTLLTESGVHLLFIHTMDMVRLHARAPAPLVCQFSLLTICTNISQTRQPSPRFIVSHSKPSNNFIRFSYAYICAQSILTRTKYFYYH